MACPAAVAARPLHGRLHRRVHAACRAASGAAPASSPPIRTQATETDDIMRQIERVKMRILMANGNAPCEVPPSPEEAAKCGGDLAEMRRKFSEDLRKAFDEYSEQIINRSINRCIGEDADDMPPALAEVLRKKFPNSPLNKPHPPRLCR